MEKTIELQVDFWQKVKYSGTIKVTEDQAEQLKDEDGGDIDQYIRVDGELVSNPLWYILQEVTTESNVFDWGDELTDLEVNEFYESED
ncbi:hypothetical protein BN1195_03626 [Chryseobacterium oranimense G311]|uniref:hypothetical protein n=1 Tax=Chryseobacterium oranimense TaxID=421058 RepID=UPI000533A4C0|nr:hypothetical protein [Chryseobacterium oranimense]CEJ71281.1 hypothetical protein BN1195_03626 [Chryseobacterium oranimense G311]